jgi:hypothetical protein
MPLDAHGAVGRRRMIAHPVLPVVRVITRGARSAGVARCPVWCRRLDAPIVPPCAGGPALWLAKPQGMAGEQNRFEDADSRTKSCGAGEKEPTRLGKERY